MFSCGEYVGEKKKLNAFFFWSSSIGQKLPITFSTNRPWFQSAFYYWLLRKTIGGSTPTSCNKRSDLHVFLVQVSAQHGTRWTSCSRQFVFYGSCTHLFNVLPALPPKLTRTDLRLSASKGPVYQQPNKKPQSDAVSNVFTQRFSESGLCCLKMLSGRGKRRWCASPGSTVLGLMILHPINE